LTAAPHRAEAYEANRFVIEAIKERLPIWKLERFPDGSEWKRTGA
jgi:molybdopterin synthase catalytic subunit